MKSVSSFSSIDIHIFQAYNITDNLYNNDNYVCFELFVPFENFFSHLETSPWLVKGCKFWPMLGTYGECFTYMETSHWPVKDYKFWHLLGVHGHSAVWVLQRATPTVTRGIRLLWPSPRTRDTHLMPIVWQWSCHYLFYNLGLSRLGFEYQTFCLLGERTNVYILYVSEPSSTTATPTVWNISKSYTNVLYQWLVIACKRIDNVLVFVRLYFLLWKMGEMYTSLYIARWKIYLLIGPWLRRLF